jgi:L-amino acid N-acyltransferase YncA
MELALATMLEDYPKMVVVKDGRRVMLRPMTAEDRDGLLAFFRGVPEEDLWYLKEDTTDPATIDSWVRNLDYDRVLPIVAECDGDIVADASLHRRVHGALSGVGKVRIVVAPEFRRQGLGMWMLLDLVNLGMRSGLDKLWVELVVDKENAAIEAFKRLGFVQEVILPNTARDPSGRQYDLVILVKSFYPDWGDY